MACSASGYNGSAGKGLADQGILGSRKEFALPFPRNKSLASNPPPKCLLDSVFLSRTPFPSSGVFLGLGGSWVLSKMDSAPLPSMVHIGSFRARSLNCARCELGLCRLSPGGHRSNLGATRSFNPPGLGVCAENRRHSICLESAKFEFNFVFYGLLSRETMEHLLLITFIRRF